MIPKLNSAHGSETRNIINAAIDAINFQGKTIQDLVAEGQLTPSQYTELITVINGLIKSGHVDKSDLTPEFKDEIEGFSTQLAQTLKKGEVTSQDLNKTSDANLWSLNDFNESTRNLLQGLDPGQINAVLGLNNVTVENTAFITKSSNLFNKATVESGIIIDLSGNEVSNSSYNTSDYIYVTPNTEYTTSKINYFSYYTADQTFISRTEIASGELEKMTRTTPSDAQYARVSVQNSQLPIAQLNLGSKVLDYEPHYKPFLSSDDVGLADNSIYANHLSSKTVGIEHTDFFEISSNLFNKNTVIEKYLVDANSGELLRNLNSNASDFIPVIAGEQYTTVGVWRVVYFDSQKNYLKMGDLGPETFTFTPPENAYYIRMTVTNENIDTARLNKGAELLPYEDFYLNINGVDLSKSSENSQEENNISTDDYYVIDGKLDETYKAPTMESAGSETTNSLWDLTFNELYSLYDDLVTNYPSYVTKTQVGTDNLGNPLYRYDFTPTYPPKEQGTPEYFKRPKMFITSATHGNERLAPWVTYQAMKQICENWQTDESLETLRFNIQFIVMPMVNPSGWAATSRQNSNGIDLNRQFPEGWYQLEPGTTSYGGTEPLTEPEAIAVANILDNEKDIIFFCDFHNFSQDDVKFLWNLGGTQFNMNIAEHLIMKMSRKWRTEIPELPQGDGDIFGYTSPTPGGSANKYAATKGIQSSILEVSERFMTETERFGALTIQLGVEAFVNWIIMNARNNIPLLNKQK